MRHPLFTAGLLLLSIPALLAPRIAAAGDCSVSARCCSADTGSCNPNTQVCACSSACGPNTSECKCTCLPAFKGILELRETLRHDLGGTRAPVSLEDDLALKVSCGTLDLDGAGALLEQASGWTVQSPPDVAARRAAGFWRGSVAEVAEGMARSFRAGVVVDAGARLITFLDR